MGHDVTFYIYVYICINPFGHIYWALNNFIYALKINFSKVNVLILYHIQIYIHPIFKNWTQFLISGTVRHYEIRSIELNSERVEQNQRLCLTRSEFCSINRISKCLTFVVGPAMYLQTTWTEFWAILTNSERPKPEPEPKSFRFGNFYRNRNGQP